MKEINIEKRIENKFDLLHFNTYNDEVKELIIEMTIFTKEICYEVINLCAENAKVTQPFYAWEKEVDEESILKTKEQIK